MRATSLVIVGLALAVSATAQVVAPEEIRDRALSDLQRKYWGELKQISAALAGHEFPYRFYFSRTLDLSEKEQQKTDQRSIQFDHYRGQTVLKITGNYFASYSAELMPPAARARQTYQDVIRPLLEAAVPSLAALGIPDAFAFEVSHHVRKKVIGISSEAAENVVLILPKASAVRAMTAPNEQARQMAMAEGEVFLNAAPVELWPGVPRQVARQEVKEVGTVAGPTSTLTPEPAVPVPALAPQPSRVAPAAERVASPKRETSPEALKKLQNSHQAVLDRLVQELNTQAHFVRYAPPVFIPFHGGLYLQLSVTTALPGSAAGSQYRLAALGFDQHVAHLIRPTLEYFKEAQGDFDGIDFSASVRAGSGDAAESSAMSVEFILSLAELRRYQQFDLTGQQLIDSGFVLINGERVGLDLQTAEAGAPAK